MSHEGKLYMIFPTNGARKKAYTALEIHSPGHTMALGIKIKNDKENKLVINFYDPNQTATHKRVFFVLKTL